MSDPRPWWIVFAGGHAYPVRGAYAVDAAAAWVEQAPRGDPDQITVLRVAAGMSPGEPNLHDGVQMADQRGFMIAADEFAYPAFGLAQAQAVFGMLMDGPSDGIDRYEVHRLPEWDGIDAVTPDDWAMIGEGRFCPRCCALRRWGLDAAGRPAFLRDGPSCEAHQQNDSVETS